MQFSDSQTIGAITVEPREDNRWAAAADDSSLGALLASLAHLPTLDDLAGPMLVASTRWTCLPDDEAGETVRADLARLLDDLQDQYDQLADCLG